MLCPGCHTDMEVDFVGNYHHCPKCGKVKFKKK